MGAGDGGAGSVRRQLSDGWEVARSLPGECEDPGAAAALEWRPARVPGTVAGALGDPWQDAGLDEHDWWFRAPRLHEPPAGDGEEMVLGLDGLATVADVYVNGELVLESTSMFRSHELDVSGRLQGGDELAICCRALAPLLAATRRPRARWRTRIASSGNLRFYRTMLFGRAPGFAPGPAVVGPWRPVWLERRHGVVLGAPPRLRARLVTVEDDRQGVLDVRATVRALGECALPDVLRVIVSGPDDELVEELEVTPGPEGIGIVRGVVTVPDVRPWWPHTHGDPVLYTVVISAAGEQLVGRPGRLPRPALPRGPGRRRTRAVRQRRARVRARRGLDPARPQRSRRQRGAAAGGALAGRRARG